MNQISRIDCIDVVSLINFVFPFCERYDRTIKVDTLVHQVNENNIYKSAINRKKLCNAYEGLENPFILKADTLVLDLLTTPPFCRSKFYLFASCQIYISMYDSYFKTTDPTSYPNIALETMKCAKDLMSHPIFVGTSPAIYLNHSYSFSYSEKKRDLIAKFFADLSMVLITERKIVANEAMLMGIKLKPIFSKLCIEDSITEESEEGKGDYFQTFSNDELRFIYFLIIVVIFPQFEKNRADIESLIIGLLSKWGITRTISHIENKDYESIKA